MITIADIFGCCCRHRRKKIQPVCTIPITQLDIFYNEMRLSRESTIVIFNSLKEKSEKIKNSS